MLPAVLHACFGLLCMLNDKISNPLRGCMQDGYAQDGFGIHHRVCTGVVETRPGTDWCACQTSTYAVPCTKTPWHLKLFKPPCAVVLAALAEHHHVVVYCCLCLPLFGYDLLLA